MKKNLYAILGVPASASADEVRQAYERQVSEIAADDAVRRLALKEAWTVLGSEQRRAAYDALLQTQVQRGTGRPVVIESAEPRGRTPLWVGIILVVLIGGGLASRKSKPVAPAAEARVAPIGQVQVINPPTPGGPAAVGPAANPSPVRAATVLNSEQLFERASASVVRVISLGANGDAFAQGSGVVIDRNTVITNCHVTDKASFLKIRHKSELYDASVHTADEAHDLCKLSVPGLNAPAVALGRVASLRVGQKVYAIGSPQGLDLTLSDGMVSSLREGPEGTLVQTTAPISPGSSGGGLFNEQAELVGIVTFQMRSGQNLNFAIPVDWIATMSNTRALAD